MTLNGGIATRLFLSPSSASASITTRSDLISTFLLLPLATTNRLSNQRNRKENICAHGIGSASSAFQGRDLILAEAFIYPNNPLMSCFSLFFKKKEVSRATHTIDVEDEVSNKMDGLNNVILLHLLSYISHAMRRLPPEEQYLVERVWEFYQKQELVNLVDTSLGGNYDVEEACNYLKIGLLCTQDVPKQRPSMSTAVLMLMGEIEVSDKISRPGMLSEFMSFKGDKMRKHGDEKDQNNKWEMKDSGKGESSSSSLGLAETSNATMTFSSIYDRDN
ncbi:hypothetical protein OIU78_025055 [Salix suchowensis]|nr:hypothetical protein OIU78_025055 [Salix suchowensis]